MFPGCGFWDKAPASRAMKTAFFHTNKLNKSPLNNQKAKTVLLTLAPIWFPHWPACRWTISLIFTGGRRHLQRMTLAFLKCVPDASTLYFILSQDPPLTPQLLFVLAVACKHAWRTEIWTNQMFKCLSAIGPIRLSITFISNVWLTSNL